MPSFEPINDGFIDLDGSSAYLSVADSLSQKGKQTVEATIDCKFDALPGTTRTFFGKSATADFSFSITSAGIVSFTVRRAGGDASSTLASSAAIVAGQRNIFYGVDDGTTVKLYVNGTVATTTASSASGAIVKDTNPLLVGAEVGGTNFTGLMVASFQVKYDGIVVLRFMARETSGTTLRDYSGYSQRITIAGTATEGTTFYWGNFWNREPAFTGSVVL